MFRCDFCLASGIVCMCQHPENTRLFAHCELTGTEHTIMIWPLGHVFGHVRHWDCDGSAVRALVERVLHVAGLAPVLVFSVPAHHCWCSVGFILQRAQALRGSISQLVSCTVGRTPEKLPALRIGDVVSLPFEGVLYSIRQDLRHATLTPQPETLNLRGTILYKGFDTKP